MNAQNKKKSVRSFYYIISLHFKMSNNDGFREVSYRKKERKGNRTQYTTPSANPPVVPKELQYTPEEIAAYEDRKANRERKNEAITKAQEQCLREVKMSLVDLKWLKDKVNQLAYEINKNTGAPNTQFIVSASKLIGTWNGHDVSNDIITVDGFELSRSHFYSNHHFKMSVVRYFEQHGLPVYIDTKGPQILFRFTVSK